jgi:site-specific DNA-methyltransferase (adenine-specific)
MKIELVSIDDLTLDPANARKHDDKNLKAIAESLKQFGQRKPIVVWGRTVVAGNGTLVAARSLGWTEITVARIPDDWSVDQVTAYALADNRSAELAVWDEQVLTEQLKQLELADWDVEALGFDATVEPLQDVVEDELPEVVDPKAKLGDVWRIGNIEIHCKDSFTLDLPKCDVIISDPPYGMKVDFSWYGGKVGESLGGDRTIVSKHTQLEKPDWDQDKFDPTKFLEHGKHIALFGANYYYEFLPPDGTWWVWDKRTTASGEVQEAYGMPYEMIWISGKRKSNIIRNLWAGFTRKAEDVDKERLHPTQKPIAVMREIIEYLSKAEDVVLDPFAGSGSTLVACYQLGRKAIGIEFDPKFVDAIIARLEKLTGQTAELIED